MEEPFALPFPNSPKINPVSPHRHLAFSASPPSSNRLLALPKTAALLLLPLAPAVAKALGGLLTFPTDAGGIAGSESASFPSRKDADEGGTGSMLLLLCFVDSVAAEEVVLTKEEEKLGLCARRLEGGRRVARALAERPEGVDVGLKGEGTGREDFREEEVSPREKAAEGGRA